MKFKSKYKYKIYFYPVNALWFIAHNCGLIFDDWTVIKSFGTKEQTLEFLELLRQPREQHIEYFE